MNHPSPVPSALHHFSAAETCDLGTVAFAELFREALLAERSTVLKLKAKARQARRFASWRVSAAEGRSDAWADHISRARNAFVDMRHDERAGRREEACERLAYTLSAWRRMVSMQHC